MSTAPEPPTTLPNSPPGRRTPPFGRSARRVVLTIHIICSVGWIGLDACLLILAVAGLTSHDSLALHTAYTSMGLLATALVAPLSIASLLTGITIAVGTPWGLLRHYWVITSLLVTMAMIPATIILLDPIIHDAVTRVRNPAAVQYGDNFDSVRGRIVVASSAELVTLCLVTALNVFKPWGLSPRGRRLRHRGTATPASRASTTRGL